MLIFVGCGADKKDDVKCTKVNVFIKGEGYKELEVTEEMNTKLVYYYSNVNTKKEKVDLALRDVIHVYYSDGAEIISDLNDDEYATYVKGDDRHIITIDCGFKEYLGNLTEK